MARNLFNKKNRTAENENQLHQGQIESNSDDSGKYKNHYFDTFNELPVGIIIFTDDFQITDVNEAFLKIFNIRKDQILNYNLSDINDKRILPAFHRVLSGNEGFYDGEYQSTFNDIELFISIHTKPFTYFHNKKQINGGLAVFQDTTEHTIAERAVNKSYDTFQRVTDSLNAIIYVVDAETFTIEFMNSKAVKVFGRNVGNICYRAFLNSDIKCDTCQLDFLTENESELGEFSEIEYYNKVTKKWYQLSYGLIEWINGRNVMILTSIDITDVIAAKEQIKKQNKKYEETLNKLQEQNRQINSQSEQLKVSGAIKDTMFSIIAHDLRGPVGNITSALNILIDDIDEFGKDEIIEIVKPVRDSAGSAYNLLVNLLFWAKNESGETFFVREEILINDIIEDVLTLFKPNFEAKNLKLVNSLQEKFYVFADEHMMHTVIRNLISNAIKYTNENGKVEISTKKIIRDENDYVRICVKDTGVGISKDNINKMLDTKEFYSTYGTNKEKGTGLGIILTKEFIERHDGFIEIESEPGVGTEISVYLPSEQM